MSIPTTEIGQLVADNSLEHGENVTLLFETLSVGEEEKPYFQKLLKLAEQVREENVTQGATKHLSKSVKAAVERATRRAVETLPVLWCEDNKHLAHCLTLKKNF